METDEGYAGQEVAAAILGCGKVVKQLEGGHKEWFVVLNTAKGFTVNQEAVRAVTGGEVQVFGVDVWRMQDLAERLYPDNPSAQRQAFLSELVYTLAVSATLTKGDLPVYLIEAAPALVAA